MQAHFMMSVGEIADELFIVYDALLLLKPKEIGPLEPEQYRQGRNDQLERVNEALRIS